MRVPTRRAYPIADAKPARETLSRVSEHGDAAQRKKLRDAVANRYPALKDGKPKPTEETS